MLEIFIINALSDNYIYLLRNEHKNITSVIDPGEAKPVIKFLNNKRWNLDEVINTHHHHDHVGGNSELLHIYKSKLIAPSYESERISNIDILVSDDETVNITGIPTKVFHTPGHTLGHVCFYMPEEKSLFSGDTLFYLGCGRVFEGTMDQMWLSLLKLRSLPEDTSVYCGHEYTKKNAEFCLKYDPNNNELIEKIAQIKKSISKGNPTIPSILREEITCNIFLKAKDVEMFSKLRDLKDNF